MDHSHTLLPRFGNCRKVSNPVILLLWSTLVDGAASFVYSPPSRSPSSSPIPTFATTPAISDEQQKQIQKQKQIPEELSHEIQSIAQTLWKDIPIPTRESYNTTTTKSYIEGEATPEGPYSKRADYFYKTAMSGCPSAQHSYGLLLWSGFANTPHNPIESAKFHAAAASQHHLDGIAVLGGCLRTGSGVSKNISLGESLIEMCANLANPTGVNKQAALLEMKQQEDDAVRLYEDAVDRGRVNALLLFNLGWCYVQGQGVERKDRSRGVAFWKDACAMAPDEGSEEAAWCLYEEYKRDDPMEAMKWFALAKDLGYDVTI